MQDGSPWPRGRGARCFSLWWSRAPSAGPLPDEHPCFAPESRGACLLTSAPLCPLHLGAPAPPSGPVWRVCWPRLSRSLSECSCPHWCSCRAVAAGYSSPVAPSALAPLVGLDCLSSLRRTWLSSLFGAWWLRTAVRQSTPALQRLESVLWVPPPWPLQRTELSRSPYCAALSSALLCMRHVYRTVLRSQLRSRYFCWSSLLSIVVRIFLLLCRPGDMYWILDTADVLSCQATLSLYVCVCVPV